MKTLFKVLFVVIFSVIGFAQQEKAAATSLPPEDDCDWAFFYAWKRGIDLGKFSIGEVSSGGTDPIRSMGIGIEKYLNNNSGLYGVLSLGIDSYSQDVTGGGTREGDQTEIGVLIGYNNYFKGVNSRISPYWGLWGKYISYSTSSTDKPQTGGETKNEFSSSSLGFGVTAGVFWQPWVDVDMDFGIGSNLGVIITPESTSTFTPSTGSAVETKGPSSTYIGDCSYGLMVRYSF
jgi:hypothetical protein